MLLLGPAKGGSNLSLPFHIGQTFYPKRNKWYGCMFHIPLKRRQISRLCPGSRNKPSVANGIFCEWNIYDDQALHWGRQEAISWFLTGNAK